MRQLITLLATVLLLTMVGACDSFVEEVDLPIDTIDDSQLTDESQIPFVITGIQSRFSTTYDRIAVFAGGISDELIFDQRVPNATFPSFKEMDDGDITFANNSNDGLYNSLGELRFFADNLLTRIGEVTFEDAALQQEAQFTANFYGGVARYFYAAYYALSQTEGGGVITDDPANPGPFVPSAQMYPLALDKLNAARGFADDYHTRVINTLVARIHLFQGNFSEARSAAQGGMVAGDADFESLHTPENTNYWYVQAGEGRHQWVVDFRYKGYVDADPAEGNRIQLIEVIGNDDPPTTFYRQDRYVERGTPLPFSTWQENELMLAELDLRDGNAAGALARINAIRDSHGIGALADANMDVLQLEREKELFTMGLRLPDQRRFGTWHLGAGTWQFLPITQSERNINPNF